MRLYGVIVAAGVLLLSATAHAGIIACNNGSYAGYGQGSGFAMGDYSVASPMMQNRNVVHRRFGRSMPVVVPAFTPPNPQPAARQVPELDGRVAAPAVVLLMAAGFMMMRRREAAAKAG
jgi:hypothetical protein